jgi:acid stress-induced BolA-like protein IbaG/YrbA
VTLKRPSGSNADEWHLFLCEYLDNRATGSGDGLAFIAVQIAEAIDDAGDLARQKIGYDTALQG